MTLLAQAAIAIAIAAIAVWQLGLKEGLIWTALIIAAVIAFIHGIHPGRRLSCGNGKQRGK